MLCAFPERGSDLASMAFLQSRRSRGAHASCDSTGLAILQFLRDNSLPATPANYALVHEYLCHPEDLIAKAVDAVLMSGVPLAEANLGELREKVRDGAAADRAGTKAEVAEAGDRSELRQQARQLAEVTADAASANERFGKGLASDLDDMFQAPETLIAQVREMIGRTESTERKLASALEKIAALREEVEAERGNAARDALTGLYNRRGIQPLLDTAAVGDVIAIVDLDRFKDMNDRYGHSVGDRVLKVVAGSLQESIVPHEIARWGGEEFLAVIVGQTAEDAAALIRDAADTLRTRRFRLRETGKRIQNVSFSAGIALIGEDGVECAMAAADRALYDAKAAGRDCVRIAAEGGATLLS